VIGGSYEVDRMSFMVDYTEQCRLEEWVDGEDWKCSKDLLLFRYSCMYIERDKAGSIHGKCTKYTDSSADDAITYQAGKTCPNSAEQCGHLVSSCESHAVGPCTLLRGLVCVRALSR